MEAESTNVTQTSRETAGNSIIPCLQKQGQQSYGNCFWDAKECIPFYFLYNTEASNMAWYVQTLNKQQHAPWEECQMKKSVIL